MTGKSVLQLQVSVSYSHGNIYKSVHQSRQLLYLMNNATSWLPEADAIFRSSRRQEIVDLLVGDICQLKICHASKVSLSAIAIDISRNFPAIDISRNFQAEQAMYGTELHDISHCTTRYNGLQSTSLIAINTSSFCLWSYLKM